MTSTTFVPNTGSIDADWLNDVNSSVYIDVANVKHFGALGNGVSDDSIAINAAINSLPASGGIVYFPVGIYYVASSIIPLDNTELDLGGSTIKGSGSLTPIIEIGGKTGVTILNGSVDGNIDNRGSVFGVAGIYGIAANSCTVRNISIFGVGAGAGRTVESGLCVGFEANDSTGYSPFIGSCSGNMVEDCEFDDQYVSFGVRFKTQWDTASVTNECYNNHARRNTFISIGKSCIEIAGSKTRNCTATYNHIIQSLIDGICVDKGASYCTVAFNAIEDVTDGLSAVVFGGISIASIFDAVGGTSVATGNRVIGNHIKTIKGSAINIAGASGTIIEDNVITEASINGIFVTTDGTSTVNPSNTIVSNNTITGIGKYQGATVSAVANAILVSLADITSIVGNTISDSPYRSIYLSNSTRNVVDGNIISTDSNSTSSYPVYVNASDNTIMSNNDISQTGADNTDSILRIISSNQMVVSSNSFSGNGVTDFSIKTVVSANNISISDNIMINHNSSVSILLGVAGTGYSVTGNIGDAGSTVTNSTGDSTAVIKHGIESSNADTTGLTLANLEIEVNQLKAVLRSQSVIQA